MHELGHRTKLSASGLVFRHFGHEVVAALVRIASGAEPPPQSVSAVFKKLYKTFMEHIDGIDNGVEAFGGSDCTRNYDVSTTLSRRVGAMNPRWNQQSSNDDADARFAYCMTLTATELFWAAEGLANSWLPARSIVAAALDRAAGWR